MSTSVTIVVVTYRSETTIGMCLRALPAACDGLEADAVVVDNNSDDFTLDAARDAGSAIKASVGVSVIARGSNAGFAIGANVGMRRGLERGSDWILFCNPDAVLPPGSVASLIAAAEGWPRPAVVSPALLNLDGSAQPMVERTYRLGRALLGMARIGGANRARPAPLVGEPQRVEWFHGAVVLASSDLMRQLGGFDEGYFLYAEDMDLCLRAARAGADCVVVPSVRVPHISGASSILGGGEVARAADRVAGMGRFLHKEHGGWARSIFGLATTLTSVPAALVSRTRGDDLAVRIQLAKARSGLRAAAGFAPRRR